MNRGLFITIHMYLSAFFAPVIFLVAISGGLYLIGVKGNVAKNEVYSSGDYFFDAKAEDLRGEVDALLTEAGAGDFDYEYVKVKGDTLYTRPTSKQHYIIKLGQKTTVTHADPSLQNALIELHKGHGPTAFKTFQKFFAAGMVLIVASGLLLGLTSSRLLPRTLAATAAGSVVFFALILI